MKSQKHSVGEGKKEVKGRKTIHQNPALVVTTEGSDEFANKDIAEEYISKNMVAGDKCTIYLKYKEYEMVEVTTTKLTSK